MGFWLTLLATTISSIVGVLVATYLNRWHWHNDQKQIALSKRADSIIVILDDFQSDAAEYWLMGERLSVLQKTKLELKVKIQILFLSKLLRKFRERCENGRTAGTELKLSKTINELFDLSTGDSFEASQLASDPRRAYRISSLVISLKEQINSLVDR